MAVLPSWVPAHFSVSSADGFEVPGLEEISPEEVESGRTRLRRDLASGPAP